jgi:hypothetical protein
VCEWPPTITSRPVTASAIRMSAGRPTWVSAMMISTPSAVSASTSFWIASISAWKMTVGRRGWRFPRVRRQRRDDADLNAVHVEDDACPRPRRRARVLAQVEVAGQDREIDHLQEADEVVGAVVEFVVADRHGVEADGLHELRGSTSPL